MISPATFFAELKSRNIRKTLAIYMSSALTTVAVVKLFLDAYGLPSSIFPIIVTFLTCGLASAFVFGWYHGTEGAQQFRKKEIVIHSILLFVAIGISIRIGGIRKPLVISADAKSIAVLPFKNMSANDEDEYFNDGITEDILTQLCKIGDLRVVSRTSIMNYKATQKNVREIAEELGVGTILEGSVRRSGNRIRIVGQLINAKTDEHLWAETYDREIELKDIFAVQSEVAQRIASSLKAALSPDELKRIDKKSTENLAAYSFYLKGRDYYNKYMEEDNERAIELFKNAIALDSTYALAYAGLGDAYGQRVNRFSKSRESADSAIAVSTKAITLDPDLAEGYKALGLAYESKGRTRQALEYYYKAVKFNPNYAPVVTNIVWANSALGNYDEALLWMKKSVLLNPGAAHRYAYVADMYAGLGDDSSAIRWYNKALALDPDLFSAHTQLTYEYLFLGEMQKARQHAEKSVSLDSSNVRAYEAAGYVQLLLGNYAKARSYFEKSIEITSLADGSGVQLAYTLLKTGKANEARIILDSTFAKYVSDISGGDEGLSTMVYLGYICSMRNDTTASLQWLRRSFDMGNRDYRWAMIDPLLENVRATAEFKQLIALMKMKVDEMRQRAQTIEAEEQHTL